MVSGGEFAEHVIAGLSSNYFSFTPSGHPVYRWSTSFGQLFADYYRRFDDAGRLEWRQIGLGESLLLNETNIWYANDRLAWSGSWRMNLNGGDAPPAYGQTHGLYGYDWSSGSLDLTGETFIDDGGGLSTNLFGYFRPGGQSLDMLVSHRVGETNHWVAEYGDWWWRITQESRRVVKASVTVTGLALGAAAVSVEIGRAHV